MNPTFLLFIEYFSWFTVVHTKIYNDSLKFGCSSLDKNSREALKDNIYLIAFEGRKENKFKTQMLRTKVG